MQLLAVKLLDNVMRTLYSLNIPVRKKLLGVFANL